MKPIFDGVNTHFVIFIKLLGCLNVQNRFQAAYVYGLVFYRYMVTKSQ